MRTNVKQCILMLISCMVLPCSNILSQGSYIDGRLSIKAGYTGIHTSNLTTGTTTKKEITPVYQIEAIYGFARFFEAGPYFNMGKFLVVGYNPLTSNYDFNKKQIPGYGIRLNAHVLPFLVKAEDFRFDLYAFGKFGFNYFNTPDYFALNGHYSHYGMGCGAAFYLFRRLGVYSEYEYFNGKIHAFNKTRFTFGLTVKIKNQ